MANEGSVGIVFLGFMGARVAFFAVLCALWGVVAFGMTSFWWLFLLAGGMADLVLGFQPRFKILSFEQPGWSLSYAKFVGVFCAVSVAVYLAQITLPFGFLLLALCAQVVWYVVEYYGHVRFNEECDKELEAQATEMVVLPQLSSNEEEEPEYH